MMMNSTGPRIPTVVSYLALSALSAPHLLSYLNLSCPSRCGRAPIFPVWLQWLPHQKGRACSGVQAGYRLSTPLHYWQSSRVSSFLQLPSPPFQVLQQQPSRLSRWPSCNIVARGCQDLCSPVKEDMSVLRTDSGKLTTQSAHKPQLHAYQSSVGRPIRQYFSKQGAVVHRTN